MMKYLGPDKSEGSDDLFPHDPRTPTACQFLLSLLVISNYSIYKRNFKINALIKLKKATLLHNEKKP